MTINIETLEMPELREWFLGHAEPISKGLPLILANGSMVESLSGNCAGCNKAISGDLMRGYFIHKDEGRIGVKGVVGCTSCKLLTRFNCDIIPEEGSWTLNGNTKVMSASELEAERIRLENLKKGSPFVGKGRVINV